MPVPGKHADIACIIEGTRRNSPILCPLRTNRQSRDNPQRMPCLMQKFDKRSGTQSAIQYRLFCPAVGVRMPV